MIRLSKNDKPEVLCEKENEWTQILLGKIRNGQEITATERTCYKHKDIKEELRQETHGKCAYCESKILHVTFGDVEHIIPKSIRPELTFVWTNLTLVCDFCNTAKGNREGVLNPYQDDPDEHLVFAGCLVVHQTGSRLGVITGRILKLNRIDLIEHRKERYEQLVALRDLLHAETDPARRAVLEEDIRTNETALSQKYAALSRWFVSDQLSSRPSKAGKKR